MVASERTCVFHLAEAVVNPLAPPKTDQELLARIQEKLHPTGSYGSRTPLVSTFEMADDEAKHTPCKPPEVLVFDPLYPPKTDAELDQQIQAKPQVVVVQTDIQELDEDTLKAATGCGLTLVGA
ncbi:MAG: hypothetical protein WAV51_00335 [Microgenomates group bacterium]